MDTNDPIIIQQQGCTMTDIFLLIIMGLIVVIPTVFWGIIGVYAVFFDNVD